MKTPSPRRWSDHNKVNSLTSLWFGIGNLFIESLQQNDHRRVCSSFGCITSRAQSRIAAHRPGTDHGPEENWEKKRKKKRWPGVQAPCLEFARMGWKAWELRHPHPCLPSLQRLREQLRFPGAGSPACRQVGGVLRGGSKEVKACPHKL